MLSGNTPRLITPYKAKVSGKQEDMGGNNVPE